jgi:hypothetical protein
MTDDLVKRLRSNASWGDDRFAEAADRIEALTAERDQWIQHAKNAVWADSEELKLLTADNAQLREAMRTIGEKCPADGLLIHSGRQIVAIIDAALTGKEPSHE